MYQLAAEENLSLDVVSGGELFTALKAGFPAERIHFHGNNKSNAEIELAFDSKIGCIVVDNFYEIQLLKDISERRQQKCVYYYVLHQVLKHIRMISSRQVKQIQNSALT